MYQQFGAREVDDTRTARFRLFIPDNTLDPGQYTAGKSPNITAVHVVGEITADMDEAIALLEAARDAFGPEVPETENPAKQMARSLAGKIPAIYGGTMLEPVARAWKAKLNGYAKTTALFDLLPLLPGLVHAALLLALGAGLLLALAAAFRGIVIPDRGAARRRIERARGLSHRPLQALADRPGMPPVSATARPGLPKSTPATASARAKTPASAPRFTAAV